MQKKKIIIFSSSGGGGHISAADALKEYLENEYYVETKQIFSDEILGILDPIKLFTFSKSTGEEIYSYFLQKKWTLLINCMYTCARWSLYLEKLIIKKILSDYLIINKPDLVISVVPLVNYLLAEVCKKLSIPFILCPTDLDVTTFIEHMKNSSTTSKICLSFNDPAILAAFYKEAIPLQSLPLTGFPLRSAFFKEYDKNAIHQDFNVPFNKPVILLLMGAVGSQAIYSYVYQLSKLTTPVHLLICLGKHEKMREKLKQIIFPDFITLSIISYTNRIADLMSIATLCITKAGSVSVCETIYKEIPMILDATSTPLIWEKFNLSFIKHHGFGEIVYNINELNPIVEHMLVDKTYFDQIKSNLNFFQKNNFGVIIKKLVTAIMQK